MPNKPIKKRYGTLAVLMHLIVPGLGFLYSGKFWTALLIPFLLLLFVFALAWSRLILEPWGLWLIWGGVFAVYLLLIPIVFWIARKNSPCILKRSQHFISYLVFVLIITLLVVSTVRYRARLFGYETFVLPSRSMVSTLLPNDYIIVDTWAYFDEPPKRGDILVFKYPPKPEVYFTKRLIAMPGEKVQIQHGKVIVNNILQYEPYVLPENNKLTSKKTYVQFVVPEKSFFVLGDNRDHSNDSRYWGFLNENAVYGKAVSTWFSFSSKGVRFNRIKRLVSEKN